MLLTSISLEGMLLPLTRVFSWMLVTHKWFFIMHVTHTSISFEVMLLPLTRVFFWMLVTSVTSKCFFMHVTHKNFFWRHVTGTPPHKCFLLNACYSQVFYCKWFNRNHVYQIPVCYKHILNGLAVVHSAHSPWGLFLWPVVPAPFPGWSPWSWQTAGPQSHPSFSLKRAALTVHPREKHS